MKGNTYECSKCGEKFEQQNQYLRHMKRKRPCGTITNLTFFKNYVEKFRIALIGGTEQEIDKFYEFLEAMYPNLTTEEQNMRTDDESPNASELLETVRATYDKFNET